MNEDTIEKSITINAPVEKVWRVFIDPSLSSEMDGKYITDWKVGGSFDWAGNDGKIYSRGTLLAFEKNVLISHDIYDAQDNGDMRSTITYRFTAQGNKTILTVTEGQIDDLDEDECEDIAEDWSETLKEIKKVAEKL